MTTIKYVTGDVTEPTESGHKLLIHVVNDCRAWGAGVVLAISAKWDQPERTFRSAKLKLKDIQIVPIEDDLTVINMCAQTGVGRKNGPPIRYEAVQDCLTQVAEYAKEKGACVIAPRFGAGLAGGKWEVIEALIKTELCEKDIPVTIYDFAPTIPVLPPFDDNEISEI